MLMATTVRTESDDPFKYLKEIIALFTSNRPSISSINHHRKLTSLLFHARVSAINPRLEKYLSQQSV